MYPVLLHHQFLYAPIKIKFFFKNSYLSGKKESGGLGIGAGLICVPLPSDEKNKRKPIKNNKIKEDSYPEKGIEKE